jgi:hypothetical protein
VLDITAAAAAVSLKSADQAPLQLERERYVCARFQAYSAAIIAKTLLAPAQPCSLCYQPSYATVCTSCYSLTPVGDVPAVSTCRTKKSIALEKRYYILNDNDATVERFKKRVCELSPLLETAILRAYRQTYNEGTDTLYRKNMFAIIVPENQRKQDIAVRFPRGIDFSRIQRLRLEIQVKYRSAREVDFHIPRRMPWAFTHDMEAIKNLQLVVSFLQ